MQLKKHLILSDIWPAAFFKTDLPVSHLDVKVEHQKNLTEIVRKETISYIHFFFFLQKGALTTSILVNLHIPYQVHVET